MATPTSPLDNLHDVIAPATVPWWPLSLPAIAIIAVVLLLLVIASYAIYQRHLLNKAKKQAIKESKAYQSCNLDNVQALHLLLKRLVKHYYGAEAASQSGEKWLELVAATSKTTLSNEELIRLYQAENNEPLTDFHNKLTKAIYRFKVKGAINV